MWLRLVLWLFVAGLVLLAWNERGGPVRDPEKIAALEARSLNEHITFDTELGGPGLHSALLTTRTPRTKLTNLTFIRIPKCGTSFMTVIRNYLDACPLKDISCAGPGGGSTRRGYLLVPGFEFSVPSDAVDAANPDCDMAHSTAAASSEAGNNISPGKTKQTSSSCSGVLSPGS